MLNTCIICGNNTGSSEHIFPASFGGRITNNDIYCAAHNKQFGSSYVSVLLNSLDVINAAIGVRPDRKKEVRPALVQGHGGETYQLTRDKVELAPPPPLDQTPELLGQENQLKFPSPAHADRWMSQQMKNGFVIASRRYGEVVTQIATEPLKVSLSLGDDAFRAALAYVALTFLAHYFPDIARTPGLDPLKRILDTGADIGDRVWWVRPKTISQLPPNPFKHGHTVVIGLSKEAGTATALFSLYGGVHFGLNLADVVLTESIRVTTHIDPLSERAHESINVISERGQMLALGTLDDGKAYLQEVWSGAVPNPLQQTFETINSDDLDRNADELLVKLLATKKLSRLERLEAIGSLVAESKQRIFNLLQRTIEEFAQGTPLEMKPYHEALKLLVIPESGASLGLSSTANAALYLAQQMMIYELNSRIEQGVLTANALKDLFHGSEGRRLMMQQIVARVLGVHKDQ